MMTEKQHRVYAFKQRQLLLAKKVAELKRIELEAAVETQRALIEFRKLDIMLFEERFKK